MDRGAWWTVVHRVAKSWTLLKQLSMHGLLQHIEYNSLCYTSKTLLLKSWNLEYSTSSQLCLGKKKKKTTQAIKLPSLTRVQCPQIKIYNHCALMIITTRKRNFSVAVSSVSWHKTPGLQYPHNPDSKESVITCHMQSCSFLPALEMIGYFKGHFSNSNQSFPFSSQMRGYISSFSRIPVLYIFSSQSGLLTMQGCRKQKSLLTKTAKRSVLEWLHWVLFSTGCSGGFWKENLG